MTKIVSYGWAVLTPPQWGPVAVDIYSVSGTRQDTMERFVADWRHGGHAGLTISKVWQRAYSRGWRLARVSIAPTHGYGS